MRYFFNVHDAKDMPDETGMDLATMAMVRAEAIRASGEILREYSAYDWPRLDWRMTFTDEAGRPVFILHFSASEPDVAA